MVWHRLTTRFRKPIKDDGPANFVVIMPSDSQYRLIIYNNINNKSITFTREILNEYLNYQQTIKPLKSTKTSSVIQGLPLSNFNS